MKSAEWREAERAGIDVGALIAEAIEAKKRAATEKYLERKTTAEEETRRKAEAKKKLSWRVTPEQLELMNLGDKEATDEFFKENWSHLCAFSYRVLRQYGYRPDVKHKGIVESDDLINQAYVDIRDGKVLFDYTGRSISHGLWRSMYYAPVGGAPDNLVYRYKERGASGTGTRRRARQEV